MTLLGIPVAMEQKTSVLGILATLPARDQLPTCPQHARSRPEFGTVEEVQTNTPRSFGEESC